MRFSGVFPLLLLVSFACSNKVQTSQCVPGMSISCTGAMSCMGYQVCTNEGTFGACQCDATTTTGAGGAGTATATNASTAVSSASVAGTSTGGPGSGSTSTGGGCTTPDCLAMGQQGMCDANLALEATDPMDGARAIGICQAYAPGGWGIKTATWVRADGAALGMGDGGQAGDGDLSLGKGIVPSFGQSVVPKEGSNMLVLSSGSARRPTDPGYHSVSGYWKDNTAHTPPAGYPKASTFCSGVTTGQPYDSAGLSVTMHTPSDAVALSFDLDFYSYEFPNYVCSTYDDQFVAFLTPKPADTIDSNISFDLMGDNISVNTPLLSVCDPQTAGGHAFACPKGAGELLGTGFDAQMNGSAATGWLETRAAVPPSSDITLQFAIWDSGDGVLDSTVLIDNFQFHTEALGPTSTTALP